MFYQRTVESQNSWSWKGPFEIVLSSCQHWTWHTRSVSLQQRDNVISHDLHQWQVAPDQPTGLPRPPMMEWLHQWTEEEELMSPGALYSLWNTPQQQSCHLSGEVRIWWMDFRWIMNWLDAHIQSVVSIQGLYWNQNCLVSASRTQTVGLSSISNWKMFG